MPTGILSGVYGRRWQANNMKALISLAIFPVIGSAAFDLDLSVFKFTRDIIAALFIRRSDHNL